MADLRARLTPPAGFGGNLAPLLGTGELGRDVLSRLLVSIRVSLPIAFLTTLSVSIRGDWLRDRLDPTLR